jgi:CheY-like chemotaxis protein
LVPPPDTAAQSRLAPGTSRPVSVLVVDDDLLVLENVAAMLDDLGHAVIEARSGEEAVRLLNRTPKVDVVVTDYAMPGMNGLQLADAVAAISPGTPVVLATGYADLLVSTRPHLPRISKPFDQAALAAVMEEAIGNQANASAHLALQPKSA